MANGFEQELKKWLDIGNKSVTNITTLEGQMGQPAKISRWYTVAKTLEFMGRIPTLSIAQVLRTATGTEQAYQEQLLKRYTKGPTQQELEAQYLTALDDYQKAGWFTFVYSSDQMTLARSNITGWDSYIKQHPPEPGTSPADLSMAKSYIDSLTGQGEAAERPATEEEMLAKGFITEPLATRIGFKGIHKTTVDEMVTWLKKVIPPPELPAGLTEPELRAYLKDSQGLTDEQLAEIDAATDEWSSQIAQYEEGRSQIAKFKEGVEAPEMPDETVGRRIKQALLQPAIPALYVAGKSMYLGQHLAPMATVFFSEISYENPINPLYYFDPDNMYKEGEVKFLKQNYQINRDVGMNWWNAWGKAWEDWEVNKWTKMGMELAADPITYLGFGLFIKLGTATKGIPIVGRLTGVLSAGEEGFITTANVPFNAIKNLMRRIGPTAGQRATRVGVAGTNSIIAEVGQKTGKNIWNMTDEEYNKVATRLIEDRLASPEMLEATRAGQAFIQRQPLTHNDTLDWARKIGKTIDEKEVTDGMVTTLNNMLDNVNVRGARFAATPIEPTAQKIVEEVLQATATNENMAIVKGLIENVYNKAIQNGMKMAKMPIAKSLKAAGTNLEKASLLESAEGVFFRNRHRGIVAAISQQVDPIVQRIWREGVDRHIIMPFARSYLISGAYAPFNWIEEVFRTMFGGGGGIYGKYAPLRFQNIGIGLIYDQEITRGVYLATEKYGATMKRLAGQRIGEVPGLGEISEAALLQQVETEFGKPILEKLLMFGWLPGRKGRIIHEAMYFPIRASQWAGGIQRAGYMTKKYTDGLWSAAPEEMNKIARGLGTFEELKAAVPGLNKKVGQAIFQDLTDAAPVGPTAMRDVIRKYNIRSIKHSEAIDAIAKYTNIDPETRVWLWDQTRTGVMWDDVGKSIDAAKSKEAEYLTLSPEGKRIWLKSLTDELLREPVGPITKNNVLAWSHALRDISMDTPVTISSLFQGAQEYVSRLPTIAAREEAWRVAYSRIEPFLEEARTQANRLMTHIRANAGSVLSPAETDELTKYLGQSIARIDEIAATRTLAMDKANELIARKVRPNSTQWREELREIWDLHWAADAKLQAQQLSAARDFDSLINPTAIPKLSINVAGRGLTPADVGNLLYAPGDKLSFGIMNSDAMMGKAYFSEIVKLEADKMAARAGLTREAMGWTDDAIGGVYDQLVNSLRSNPEMHGILTAKYAELDNMARDLESIRINSSFNKSTKAALTRWVNKRASNIEGLDIYAKPTIGVAPTTRWNNITFVDLSNKAINSLKRIVGDLPLPPTVKGFRINAQLEKERITAARYLPEEGIIEFARPGIITEADGTTLLHELYHAFEHSMWESSDTSFIKAYMKLNVPAKEVEEWILSNWGKGNIRDGLFKAPQKVISYVENTADDFSEALIGTFDDPISKLMYQTFKKPAITPPVALGAKEGTADWWAKKQKAMDSALTDYYKDFTDYTHMNALDDLIRQIFPYWQYESQRWFWLPRNFLTHPGVMNTWGKYMDNSDNGYVHVPGTNLDVNITRGTVYKGGMSTLLRRDYPEYYDKMFPDFFRGMDYFQRWGFYPNVFWNLLTTSFGGRQQQWGQLLPAIVRTPIDLYVAAHPGSSVAKNLQDTILPDYFREYQMMAVVSDIATNDQINRDITGVTIWNKIQNHQDLTTEEQELWDRARDKVATYAPLIEHGGVFRMRQEDRVKAFNLWGQFIEEKTGVSVEMQKELSRRGYSVGDVCSGLSELNIMQIEEAQEYKRWISPRLTSSLRPSSEIEVNLIQTEFWNMVNTNSEKNKDRIADLETKTFKDRTMSTKDYVAAMKGINEENSRYIHQLHGDKYNGATGKWEVDPAHKTKYSDIPLTLEERAAYYAMKGVNLSMNPFDEMLAMWYGTGIKTKIDRETGLPYEDWGTYFATQDAITRLMPEYLRAQWESYLRRNETPGRAMYREAMKEFIVPYYNVANVIKSTFSQQEQDLIDEYYLVKDIDIVRASEIEAITLANGLQLISQYRSRLSSARKKLRMVSPLTDAQLRFWGVTTSFLTPQAEQLYNELVAKGASI